MADDKAPGDGATAAEAVAPVKAKAAPSANGKPRPKLVSCRIPIRDGFTQTDTYKGAASRYHGVAISYRPALQQQVADYLDDPRPFLVKAREIVERHVTGWNIPDDTGENVAKIDAATVKEIVYPVISWMVDCITGYAPVVEADDAKN